MKHRNTLHHPNFRFFSLKFLKPRHDRHAKNWLKSDFNLGYYPDRPLRNSYDMTKNNNRSRPEMIISQRRDQIFSRAIISISILAFIMTFVAVSQGLYLAGTIDLSLALILFFAWLLNTNFKKISKILALLSLNLGFLFFSLSYPKEAALYLLFLPLIVLATVVFHKEENLFRYILALLPIVCLVVLFTADIDMIPQGEIALSQIETSLRLNLFSTVVILSAILFFNICIGDNTEQWLSDFAKEADKRSEHFEKANEQLDRFLHRTTHDLRSPLASVKGLVTIASDETKDPNILGLLKRMIERIDHLDTFSKDLIEYSKNSLTDVKYEPIDLRSVVMNVIESLRYIKGKDNIQFQVNVPEKTNYFLDKRRITMIMNNLIGNAIKYHNTDQTAPIIKIDIERSDAEKKIRIVVEDNGSGISHEYHGKVFDMFFRATTLSTGSGLGLFMVKEEINKMNGDIQLKSEPGKGTTFSIVLPIRGHERFDTFIESHFEKGTSPLLN